LDRKKYDGRIVPMRFWFDRNKSADGLDAPPTA